MSEAALRTMRTVIGEGVTFEIQTMLYFGLYSGLYSGTRIPRLEAAGIIALLSRHVWCGMEAVRATIERAVKPLAGGLGIFLKWMVWIP